MNYDARLEKLKKHCADNNCDILLIEDVINIYYMTGIQLSAGKLFIDSKGAALFVDSRYFESCQKKSPFPTYLLSDANIEDWLFSRHAFKNFAFDSSTTPYTRFLSLKKQINAIKKRAGKDRPIKLIAFDAPLRPLRCIKDEDEINLLRKAANLGSEGFDFLCNSLEPGISELEMAVELEIFWKRRGADGLGFDPIIAFGANASMPHYRPGHRRLKIGDALLIDIGVKLSHYHSDMTRSLMSELSSDKLNAIYDTVREAQSRALELCKPGTPIRKLDEAARGYITKKGYGEFFTHNLGHGVGLEIHEAPTLSAKGCDKNLKLEKGMVITIEPGIYLPNVGGVRIEDTVVITDNGHENLTKRPV